MGFGVKYEKVEDFAEGIGVLDLASGAAADYATAHVRYAAGIGDLLAHLHSLTSSHGPTVRAAMEYLQLIARESSAELSKAAAYYRDTDEDVAASYDRRYPR